MINNEQYQPISLSECVGTIEWLNLPKKLIFIDLDGTIIPDDAVYGDIDALDAAHFHHALDRVIAQGVEVGLNSDSPLPELHAFAEKLGIAGPIIAENGNIIQYHGKKMHISSLVDISSIKANIMSIAENQPVIQVDDCINTTFGGTPIDVQTQWAFGAHRETSVSVFGPEHFITRLGTLFPLCPDISVDCSPEYHYFAVHPGKYKENKGKTLSALVKHGHTVVMIGNSASDWVGQESGVQCAFVGESRITQEIAVQSLYLSQLPIIQGVTDILEHLHI